MGNLNATLQEAVEQQAAAAQEVRAAAAEVRQAVAAPVTLGEEQWGLLGRRLAALQSELQVGIPCRAAAAWQQVELCLAMQLPGLDRGQLRIGKWHAC